MATPIAQKNLLLADLTIKAVRALLELVAEPQRAPLSSVLAFQTAWSQLPLDVKADPALRKPAQESALDGGYGPKTGRQMSTFILGIAAKLKMSLTWDSKRNDRLLPARAANLPLWGNKNIAAINAMRLWLAHTMAGQAAQAAASNQTSIVDSVVNTQKTQAETVQQRVSDATTASLPPEPAPRVIIPLPEKRDPARIAIAVGSMAVLATGVLYWFWFSKPKRKKKR